MNTPLTQALIKLGLNHFPGAGPKTFVANAGEKVLVVTDTLDENDLAGYDQATRYSVLIATDQGVIFKGYFENAENAIRAAIIKAND